MAEDVKGYSINIGGDTSAFTKSLKALNGDIAKTTKNLNSVNNLLKLDPSNVELAAEKDKLLTKAVEETSNKLKNLKDNQAAVNKAYEEGKIPTESYLQFEKEIVNTQKKLDKLQGQEEKTEKATEEMGNEAKESAGKLEVLEKKAEDLGNEAKDSSVKVALLGEKAADTGNTFKSVFSAEVAVSALKAIGQAGKEAAKAVIEVGSSYESSMSNVAATMGMTADEVNSGSKDFTLLSDAAKECGETTKYTASEAADALNYLALAGYDAQKAADTLPKVLNLATASGMDLASCTDMVTDSMSALKLDTSDLDGYMDMMAKTAQKSNTNVAQLGEGILECAGTVKSTGQDVDKMCTSLGILANNGIKGAEGGTHLRNMLLSLTAPTDKAKAKLDELGISVTDNSGNIRDINDIFADMNSQLGNLSESDKSNALSDIFNKTDLASVSAMLSGANGSFAELNTQVNNASGACATMADTMNNNLKGKMTIMQSSLEGLGIAAYEKFDKPLSKAVSAGTKEFEKLTKSIKEGDLSDDFDKMGDSFGNLVDTGAKFVDGALPILIDGVTWFCNNSNVVIGGLTGIASAMLTQKTINVISGVVSATKAFTIATNGATAAQTALNAAQNISPWGLLATGIGLAVGGIVAYATSADDASSATADLTVEQQDLIDKCDEANAKLTDQAQTRADNSEKISAEYGGYEVLATKLYELNDIEGKTNGQQAEMSAIVDKLNEGIPNLNLSISDHTGKLNLDKKAVQESIEKQKEYYMVMAAQDNLVEIGKSLFETKQNLTDAEKEYAIQTEKVNELNEKGMELVTKMADAQEKVQAGDKTGEAQKQFDAAKKSAEATRKEYDKAVATQKELKNTVDTTKDSYNGLNKEYKKTTDYINDNSDAMDENTAATDKSTASLDKQAESVEKVKNVTYEYSGEMYTISQETMASIDEINQKYDDAVQSRTNELMNNLNVFEQFNGGAEISASQLMENLEGNLNGVTSWSENLSTLASRGIDEGILKTLTDAGPSSATKVQALCSMTEPELQKYNELWKKTYDECYKSAEKYHADLKEETDKQVGELINDEKIYNDFFDRWQVIGENCAEGYVQGLNDKQESVWQASTDMALGSLNAVHLAFDQHSPSKKFRKIAHNNAEGEILGVKDKQKDVISAYAEMDNAVLATQNSYREANKTARAVYSGSFADSIVTEKEKVVESANAKESQQAYNFPENVTVQTVMPSGEVIAKATYPFMDILLGDQITRKKRGGA